MWRIKGRKKCWMKEFKTVLNLRKFHKANGKLSDQRPLLEESYVLQKDVCFISPSVFSHFLVEPVGSIASAWMGLYIWECNIWGCQSIWCSMQLEAHTHDHPMKKLRNWDNSTEVTEIKWQTLSQAVWFQSHAYSIVHLK